jgi:hypothetical protein
MSMSEEEAYDLFETYAKWLEIVRPGYLMMNTGPKGYGKTHFSTNIAFFAWICGYHVITNKVFKKKIAPGKFELCYPENVHSIKSHFDIVKWTSVAMREGAPVYVDLDETQNYLSSYHWSDAMVSDLTTYLSVARKFRQFWCLSTTAPEWIPAMIRIWSRCNLKLSTFKHDGNTTEYNKKNKTDLTEKELTFMEVPGCSIEPILVGVTDWTVSEDDCPVGEIVFDQMVSGARVKPGGFYYYDEKQVRQFHEFRYSSILDRLEGNIAQDLPGIMDRFIQEFQEAIDKGNPDGTLAEEAPPLDPVKVISSASELITPSMGKKAAMAVEANWIRYQSLFTRRRPVDLMDGIKFTKPRTVRDQVKRTRDEAGIVLEDNDEPGDIDEEMEVADGIVNGTPK